MMLSGKRTSSFHPATPTVKSTLNQPSTWTLAVLPGVIASSCHTTPRLSSTGERTVRTVLFTTQWVLMSVWETISLFSCPSHWRQMTIDSDPTQWSLTPLSSVHCRRGWSGWWLPTATDPSAIHRPVLWIHSWFLTSHLTATFCSPLLQQLSQISEGSFRTLLSLRWS